MRLEFKVERPAYMRDADWAKFTGPSVVVLRNGQTINGSLYDIGGASPLKLTIRGLSVKRYCLWLTLKT